MKNYMEYVSLDEALKAGRNDTICWDCANAMNGGCTWANPIEQKPIEGWMAEETDMGYRVINCPEFKRCTYGCGRYRTADDYILALETRVTEQKRQIASLKKNMWWKTAYRLRCEKRKLSLMVTELREKLNALEMEKQGKEESK